MLVSSPDRGRPHQWDVQAAAAVAHGSGLIGRWAMPPKTKIKGEQ